MSNAINWFYNKKLKTSAYEEMIDGESFIRINKGQEEMLIPIKTWRLMMKTWEEKKWESKFDSLDVVDECFEEEE